MKEVPLKVYKASAGSGKTFTLAVEYIKLLVNDPESYDEMSATAMFAYAFAEGVRAGVRGDEYLPAAKKAYRALAARLDVHGNLPDVCVGTGWKNDRHHYLTRPKANGDPHGQAPLLWLCSALSGQD